MVENDDGYKAWFEKWITDPLKTGVRAPSAFFLPIIAFDNPWIYLRELANHVLRAREKQKPFDVNGYVRALSDHDLQSIIEAFTIPERSPGEEHILIFVQLIMQIEGHTFFYNGEDKTEIVNGCISFRNDVAAMFAVEQEFRMNDLPYPVHSPFASYNTKSWVPKKEFEK